MTRAERMFYRRRTMLWIVAALLFLGGAIGVVWLQGQQQVGDLADEADLRGGAVSTLAADVRVLRAQIEAKGETPAAPDPEQAVEDLPDRAEVPVPIPGPKGDKGDPGEPGRPAPTITPEPGQPGDDGNPGEAGQDGQPGQAGQPGEKGDPGEQGDKGEQGEQGPRGEQGPAGQACPTGYSWQAPKNDPDALVCRRDGAPPPDEPGLLSSAALDPSRRQYP
ncbi:collagen-like protein [Streptomyces lunaelactis]|uniref:collagen-like protein n=1 Tax=Streptomyces lunaelactis TaxID=1535768 RepID=UPI001584DBA5|nr:collagen-like protein [Streptomyces lunaelactis]NUK22081.1 collagen-like protein [Streptomyces lunaelactis]